MELLDYLAKSAIVTANIIIGATVFLFFSVKILTKYTDLGLKKKEQKEKSEKIYNTKDNTSIGKGDLVFSKEKPVIETSFGDKRIGDVYDNPSQTK
jgi:precorrin-6B methylase 1